MYFIYFLINKWFSHFIDYFFPIFPEAYEVIEAEPTKKPPHPSSSLPINIHSYLIMLYRSHSTRNTCIDNTQQMWILQRRNNPLLIIQLSIHRYFTGMCPWLNPYRHLKSFREGSEEFDPYRESNERCHATMGYCWSGNVQYRNQDKRVHS